MLPDGLYETYIPARPTQKAILDVEEQERSTEKASLRKLAMA